MYICILILLLLRTIFKKLKEMITENILLLHLKSELLQFLKFSLKYYEQIVDNIFKKRIEKIMTKMCQHTIYYAYY